MQKEFLGGKPVGVTLALTFAALSVWWLSNSVTDPRQGRIDATRFQTAPGVVEYAWGNAFGKPMNERPCKVPEIEKVAFKVQSIDPPRVLYSCNTWWLDNVVIAIREIAGNGSREDFIEESSVLPIGYKPHTN